MSPPKILSPNDVPDKYPFLTRREFEISAKSFIEQSRKAGDIETWNWVEHEKLKGFGYLCKKSIIKKVTDKNSAKTMDEVEDDEILEYEDPNALATLNNPEDYLTVDYHIIYSTSYKVPVLYFNSYHNDGTSLLIDEIYSNLMQSSRINNIKTVGFNGGISQQDHPTLSIPFYYLHPCETATLMKSIVGFNSQNSKVCQQELIENDKSEYNNNNIIIKKGEKSKTNEKSLYEENKSLPQIITLEGYIRSWLSLVGPVVGVKISFNSQNSKVCQQELIENDKSEYNNNNIIIKKGEKSKTNEKSLYEENKSLPQIITLEGYIRSWLSLVGPVVGVKISIGYLL
ncbi:hypothetical protein Glove_396g107 [Diversispora epigaea]|uniref:Ubiquitin-like-conjugating enzyme ATG10 n=1 Tax=Diversispora epigaea TaxID=1348612 RepID=A0A397H1M3_9GLOM|nr:hypothetical protein Glove_396g107 [Diversispora epigaea]